MRNKILDILLPPFRFGYIELVDTTRIIIPSRLSLYQRLRCIYNNQKEPEEEIIIELDEGSIQ